MFGSEDAALGKEFSIQGLPFTIIGIFKESVDTFGQTEIADQTILIPFSVARYFTGTDDVKQIYFTIRSMDEVPEATREIQRVIQARHKPNSVYKQLFVKDRWVAARTLYGQTMGEDARSAAQVAADYRLPVEVVLEAITYCESRPPEFREDWEREETSMQTAITDQSKAPQKAESPLLSPQDPVRFNRS
jgi:hypothetical protein